MGVGLNGIIFDDLEFQGFQGHCISVEVEYLKNGATLLNSTTHNYRPPGAVPKTCKN